MPTSRISVKAYAGFGKFSRLHTVIVAVRL